MHDCHNKTSAVHIRIYTVNYKKDGTTFVIITVENLDGF